MARSWPTGSHRPLYDQRAFCLFFQRALPKEASCIEFVSRLAPLVEPAGLWDIGSNIPSSLRIKGRIISNGWHGQRA